MRKPSKTELEALAGELLAELMALPERAETKSESVSDHGARAALGGSQSEALGERKIAQELRERQRALAFQMAALEEGGVSAEGAATADGAALGRGGLRNGLLNEASRAPRRARRNGVSGGAIDEKYEKAAPETGEGMSAESLSEAFRRDARRYDGAFEKY